MRDSPRPLDKIAARRRIPAATYRLQFNREFTFAQAGHIADYLRDLGISDAYASPLFQAGPESTHGYDICSFEQFSPALGGGEGFAAFSARLRELGLGLILDMVPNHMGNDLSNAWWADVLQHGRHSPFALHFDIDWQPLQTNLDGQVLLPTLEDHYAHVLENGQLRLTCHEGAFAIAYHDRRFPVALESYAAILAEVLASLELGPGAALADEVRSLRAELRHLPKTSDALSTAMVRVQKRLAGWSQSSRHFQDAVELTCRLYNGQQGNPRSFDKLDTLLRAQHYRLAFWRVGPEEINYRRFFDVTTLVSLRMELPKVFELCHQLIFKLLKNGELSGLRIDHPDGLWDPKEYCRRLQAGFFLTQMPAEKAGGEQTESAVGRWLNERIEPIERQLMHQPIEGGHTGHTLEAPRNDPLAAKVPRPAWPLYVLVEKILSGEEPLRDDWPVEGTTGYDYLNKLNGLFIDSANQDRFDQLYRQFTGNALDFPETACQGKKRVLQLSLISELNALTHRLKRLALKTRYGQDFTFRQLHTALAELITAFPVYRTYVTENATEVVPQERFYVEQAIAQAKARTPAIETLVFDFLQDLLLLRFPADFNEETIRLGRDWILRFQQLTGPVTAKGVEDTAFYNYNRLISLNEVGGEPDLFGVSVEAFHHYNLAKAERWPHSLLATATHDTKRGEDVRARINVLSEFPEEWHAAIRRWSEWNRDKKTQVDGQSAPHPNDEYLLYQTLIGAWPAEDPPLVSLLPSASQRAPEGSFDSGAFCERIAAYMTKALKEGKARTSWTEPNAPYEEATHRFIERILDPHESGPFLNDLKPFQKKIAFFGQINSLAQVMLKTSSPGVPDVYQGTELWDLSLVDPDNRRPVDYTLRRRLLQDLAARSNSVPLVELVRDLLQQSHTGQLKLFVLSRALAFRRQHPDLFSQGSYLSISVFGSKHAHVCAFARIHEGQALLAVVPRLVAGLTGGAEQLPVGEVWLDTALALPEGCPAGDYRNVLTGEYVTLNAAADRALPLSRVLTQLPIALIERGG